MMLKSAWYTCGRISGVVLLATFFALQVFAQAPIATPQASASTDSMPDPATLLKRVQGNQEKLEAARRDYISRRKDVEFDSQGRLKANDVRVYDVFFVGHWEIDRLVSKDGKPLSAEESHKQDEDVQKQEAKAREIAAKEASGEDPGKDTITAGKFLAADRFYNLRRVNYQGREVYAMDFSPRPDFKPHSLLDRLLNAMGGTVWIDEQAEQVVRVEARFLQGVKVGGGLIGSLQKGGNVFLEYKFVNGEVWMPSYAEFHLDGRLLFVHKSMNGTFTYTDYKKFRVEILNSVPATPHTNPAN